MNKVTPKFIFNQDFQWAIIRYTLTDKNGFKAINLYKPEYFDVNYQKFIAEGIKHYYKRKKRIPDSVALGEELRKLFQTRKYVEEFLSTDRTKILKKCRNLFKKHVKNPDDILEGVVQFASYVEFRNTLDSINIDDFSQYKTYSKKIQNAINVGQEFNEEKGIYIVDGIRARQQQRQNSEDIFPTPIKQLNKSTNGGGYVKGSVIVLMDKGKGGKTKNLVNVATGYLKMRKKVLYIDLENGQLSIADRIDQNLLGKTKKQIRSGEFDDKLRKVLRQYKRLGAEILIKRLPSLVSTTDDIQKVYDDAYSEFGFKAEIIIIDYVANMGCLSGIKNEDTQRISQAYIDVKNFAQKNNIEIIWTGHHTTREAEKRRATCYEPSDTAKCLDVHRHVDAMIGINQNNIEKENGVFRWEIIDQRDGVGDFKSLFKDQPEFQRIKEFHSSELEAYYNQEKEFQEKVKKDPKRKPINDL